MQTLPFHFILVAMTVIEPSPMQYRTAGFALIVVAALTGAMIALTWADGVGGALLLPIVVAYFLFNVGFIIPVVRGRLQTKGARLGLTAVGLNFLAMVLSNVVALWTAASACAAVVALVAASLLFKEARASAP